MKPAKYFNTAAAAIFGFSMMAACTRNGQPPPAVPVENETTPLSLAELEYELDQKIANNLRRVRSDFGIALEETDAKPVEKLESPAHGPSCYTLASGQGLIYSDDRLGRDFRAVLFVAREVPARYRNGQPVPAEEGVDSDFMTGNLFLTHLQENRENHTRNRRIDFRNDFRVGCYETEAGIRVLQRTVNDRIYAQFLSQIEGVLLDARAKALEAAKQSPAVTKLSAPAR